MNIIILISTLLAILVQLCSAQYEGIFGVLNGRGRGGNYDEYGGGRRNNGEYVGRERGGYDAGMGRGRFMNW